VLTKKGVSGKIAEVGVGFGTGRHIQKRKSSSPNQKLIEKRARGDLKIPKLKLKKTKEQ